MTELKKMTPEEIAGALLNTFNVALDDLRKAVGDGEAPQIHPIINSGILDLSMGAEDFCRLHADESGEPRFYIAQAICEAGEAIVTLLELNDVADARIAEIEGQTPATIKKGKGKQLIVDAIERNVACLLEDEIENLNANDVAEALDKLGARVHELEAELKS